MLVSWATVVELEHAARRLPAPDTAKPAPAARARKSRLLSEPGRSFGWCVIDSPPEFGRRGGGALSHGKCASFK